MDSPQNAVNRESRPMNTLLASTDRPYWTPWRDVRNRLGQFRSQPRIRPTLLDGRPWQLQQWPRWTFPPLKVWAGSLAGAFALLLLLAFQQVVQSTLQQGQLRRHAAAAVADASWRCPALLGSEAVRQCLAGLNTASAPTPTPLAPATLSGGAEPILARP
jgi:hypothetical protein